MSSIKNLIQEASDVNLTPIHTTQCIGTSKQMQFNMSYFKLVDVLGPPTINPPGSDVKVEWCYRVTTDTDEFICSIYNDPHYYDHVDPQQMDKWCIGCDSNYHASIVLLYLRSK